MTADVVSDRSQSLGADGAIDADTPCRRCSYNLRGLTEENRCPECATAVGLSIRGDLLRFADPEWLDTLARGLLLIVGAMAFDVLVNLLAVIPTVMSPVVETLLRFAAGLIQVYGAWLLTVRDPSGLGEEQYGTVRKVVRLGLLAGLLGGAFHMAVFSAGFGGVALVFLELLGASLGLVAMVGVFAKFLYLEKLAMRIPDRSLASSARFIRWAYTISEVLMILMYTLYVAIRSGLVSGAGSVPVAIGAVIANLIFRLMAIHLQWRLRRTLRCAAAFARQTWTQAIAAPGRQLDRTARANRP